MRLRHAALAASGILLAALAIIVSGAQLVPQQPTFQPDPTDISDAELADTAPQTPADQGDHEAASPNDDTAADDEQQDVTVAPSEAAPEPQDQGPPAEAEKPELERLPPRPPLSELASPQQPSPPKTKMPDEWKSTRLFNPVVSTAATIEAQGHHIALAGVEPIPSERNCTFEGKEWPCGLLARTAFRSWLRGRAVSCVVPPDPDREIIMAECHVGKVDLSEWVVANGWAEAAADGPYADVGRKAAETHKGIFGPAPAKGEVNLPRVADPAPMAFPETGPATEEPPGVAAPVQPPLTGPFPPAPLAPAP